MDNLWITYGKSMDNPWIWLIYPLVMTNSSLLKTVLEIVGFPNENGDFHSDVKLPEGMLPVSSKSRDFMIFVQGKVDIKA